MVTQQRKLHPKMGGKKLYHLLKPELTASGIKMGRDAFFALLAAQGLLVKSKRKIPYKKRNNNERKYSNLIKEMPITAPNQVWVSDITYWKNNGRQYYITLIMDAYSRKIIGSKLSNTLETTHNIEALKIAFREKKHIPENLIHHSDQGCQYTSKEYTALLKEQGIQISMSAAGCPGQNARAERVNGIIKNEYLKLAPVQPHHDGAKLLKSVIKKYNQSRPHMSCGMRTPDEVYYGKAGEKKLWKYTRKVYISNGVKPIEKVVYLDDKNMR